MIICAAGSDFECGIFFLEKNTFPDYADYTVSVGAGIVKIRINAGGQTFKILQTTAAHDIRRIYAR